ncbi:MAG TPA: response regulator transcription factor [Candidatus Sulfotelmatobacter sp.]|nr:response regulator transcription factor [Candidatus Sulfotelmatobacter sp.]
MAENRLLREALIRLLSKKNDVRVVGANGYSPVVYEDILAANPQIILSDSSGLSFPKTTLIASLSATIPNLKIVMVDMEPDEDTFLQAVRAGVVGYVLKNASAAEVAATIRAVVAGHAVCPPSLSMILFRSVAKHESMSVAGTLGADLGLSRREQQMVELLRERLTNKEIAVRLNLSEQTVKNHIHHILRKLGAPNRSSVIQLCEKASA